MSASDEDKAQSPLDALEGLLTSLKDVEGRQQDLIEKLAGAQLQATEAGLEALAESIGRPFSDAAKTGEALSELVKDLEMERNRVRNQAS